MRLMVSMEEIYPPILNHLSLVLSQCVDMSECY